MTCVKKLRILLADDDPIVLAGLRELLSSEFEVVGSVHNGRSLLDAARSLDADVAVVDVTMPVLSGIEAIHELKKIAPKIGIVMLSMHADSAYVTESLRAGASGYVLKEHSFADLPAAIRAVSQGQGFLTTSLRKTV